MSKNKVIFLTTGVILGIALIIVALFLAFSKKNKADLGIGFKTGTAPLTRNKQESINNGPKVDEAKTNHKEPRLKLITDKAIFKVVVNGDKILIFSKKGEIFESDLGGQVMKALRKESADLVGVVVASDFKKAIIMEFDQTGKLSNLLIDLSTYQEIKLPENISSPAFSPDGKQIAFHYHDPVGGVNAIATSLVDAFKINVVFSVNMYQINLLWPEENSLYILHDPSSVIEDNLYKLDIKKKELIKTNISGNGLVAKVVGHNILYSRVNGLGKNLRLFASLADSQSLDLPISTLATKCDSLDQENLICAQSLNWADKVLPDDYYKYKISSIDEFIKINLKTNETIKIATLDDLAEEFDAVELVSNSKYLFFIDRKDGKLYRLTL